MIKPGGIGSDQPSGPSADPSDSKSSSPIKGRGANSRGRPSLGTKKFNSEDSHSSHGG